MSGSRHEPRFPGWEERVRESFARQGLMRHLGIRIASLEPGRCTLAVDRGPELTQQHGYFHAGVTSAMADSAGGYAAYTLFPERTEVLTVEFKVNLIAPAIGERLEATGTVLRSGHRLTICEVRVVADHEGRARTCAVMLQTLIPVSTETEGQGGAS